MFQLELFEFAQLLNPPIFPMLFAFNNRAMYSLILFFILKQIITTILMRWIIIINPTIYVYNVF